MWNIWFRTVSYCRWSSSGSLINILKTLKILLFILLEFTFELESFTVATQIGLWCSNVTYESREYHNSNFDSALFAIPCYTNKHTHSFTRLIKLHHILTYIYTGGWIFLSLCISFFVSFRFILFHFSFVFFLFLKVEKLTLYKCFSEKYNIKYSIRNVYTGTYTL